MEKNTDIKELINSYKHYSSILSEKIKKDISEIMYAIGGEYEIGISCDSINYWSLFLYKLDGETKEVPCIEIEWVDESFGISPLSEINNTDALIRIWEKFIEQVEVDFEFLDYRK